ncbi:MAG TPA: NAD-dependent malic enzyme [Acholeplasmataceae bacterium]|nr:MAG: malate dehydrogenase [Tenericutes bacterium GWE2_38_8]HBG32549.1 NAD-dependent malic enzyme [Acholeplasmataceae bacterium]HBY64893.1 NAD-dependent malic enzyme [Acholeplasmataceae bacterium]HCB66685.1 NAD-dependent malic enzyme [Acholeplasmataceae bacterium]
MSEKSESILAHEKLGGKIEITSRAKINNREDLSILYTPGVAEPCLEIMMDPTLSYTYTRRHNLIAVITDGSAVLGLGNIGPEAGMPVMEGKALLFKEFGDIDAVPLCIRTQDSAELIKTISLLAGSFGGINLEDISAPRCFEIEDALKKICDIPIFHDDQHGTAVVVGAALSNALKVVHKKLDEVKIVINGVGAAGTAICHFLLSLGARNIILVDKSGILSEGDDTQSIEHQLLAKKTNRRKEKGTLKDAMKNADVFIGVSAPNIVTEDMIRSMNFHSIVFPLANPKPEITREEAMEAEAFIIGTGSSKFPNQINNLLAFPGIFRGTLDAHAKEITMDMLKAASSAIANMIPEAELSRENIIPNPLDKRVHQAVAKAVKESAEKTKVAKTH